MARRKAKETAIEIEESIAEDTPPDEVIEAVVGPRQRYRLLLDLEYDSLNGGKHKGKAGEFVDDVPEVNAKGWCGTRIMEPAD